MLDIEGLTRRQIRIWNRHRLDMLAAVRELNQAEMHSIAKALQDAINAGDAQIEESFRKINLPSLCTDRLNDFPC